ncbi:hypothetical protein [Enterococcus faecalis]|uniref:hypothetical protein n=2 Tax=Enterococcus faecalis TaxID=1351 RepID=UPI00046C730A|nr:hypothetical protein [Enterococcus faecalis]MBJ0379977.1 hypothetical protein [Enterococcus faecalis]NSR04088.1 hypothetical protein [Enterococcus faecalis]HAP4356443.1 hypothetical protein [Enterococcus faecalis]HAP4873582.1 hypothetical protein [Enterococcus faecalis]
MTLFAGLCIGFLVFTMFVAGFEHRWKLFAVEWMLFLIFLATFLLLLQRSLCFFSVITEKNAKRLKKVGRIIGILGFLYMGLFFCIEWINNPGDDERKLTLFGWGAFLLCTLSYWLDYHHLLKNKRGTNHEKNNKSNRKL